MSTLLGPEGTNHTVCVFVVSGCQAWPVVAYRFPGQRVFLAGGAGCGGCGLWVGRLLRIAQWTRASLWSSCQGRTVDALAPGADEGRGRPR
jgi:hypothetical protein